VQVGGHNIWRKACFEETTVTVRLSLNLFIGCWGYTLDREDKVSGETSVMILLSS
jgi:hypothetical protein